jgi:hypothetical protein
MAVIVLMIVVTNLFNCLNATTKQMAGAWGWGVIWPNRG